MSRDWTQEELQNTSKAMKVTGHLGYEEFCEQLDKTIFKAYCKDADNNFIKISGPYNRKEEFEKQLQEHFSHLKVITVLSEEDIAFIREALE
ncbi:hypothetical protein [Syntrophomonas wolfei]|uniref:hypothetical protein n=1 Tax=Syntrophomonas wolfei TaxID=863 RepID=UPI0007747AC0|nr:hypothetical protein [Syntrophomonas wolfei]